MEIECPKCESTEIVKNGSIHTGAQKYRCKACRRQFILNPQPYRINSETRALVDKLVLERLSLAAIARVTGVSKRWLQYYMKAVYAAQNIEGEIVPKKKDL
jgi:insertion element IS1 protein InsB